MKIGIDARGLEKNKTGIGTYTCEIIKILNEIDKENEYILYSNREIILDVKLNNNWTIKKYKAPLGSFGLYYIIPKMLKEDNIDVFWGVQHCLPKKNNITKNIKFIVTVHDLAIEKLKNVGSFKNTIVQKIFLKRSCKNADEIIAISEATKNDLISIFNIPNDKINVIYNGVNLKESNPLPTEKEQEILNKFNVLDKNYIFFVSTIEPRKNIVTLIKAFEDIKEKEKDTLKLILSGGLGWKYKDVLTCISKSKYKDDILLTGYISKEEKNCLYKNNRCFVYPSLYEGFGLPILEAMSNHSVVVTSNVSSIPEVGGDVAIYYNNVKDYKELSETILKAIKMSEKEKEEIINRGLEQVKKFTWEKCAKETLQILKKQFLFE